MKVFFGASGFAKEAYWLYKRQQQAKQQTFDDIEYFIVSDHEVLSPSFLKGIEIIHESVFFEQFEGSNLTAYIAIGSSTIRKKVVHKILSWNDQVYFPSLIDPSVIMDNDPETISIGQGVIICAGNIITTDVIIDDFVHVNLDCTIGHDTTIASFSTLSPGCHISGHVKIGECVFSGTGAVILEGISIAHHAILGAGAVITKDILEKGTYIGIPAKKIK